MTHTIRGRIGSAAAAIVLLGGAGMILAATSGTAEAAQITQPTPVVPVPCQSSEETPDQHGLSGAGYLPCTIAQFGPLEAGTTQSKPITFTNDSPGTLTVGQGYTGVGYAYANVREGYITSSGDSPPGNLTWGTSTLSFPSSTVTVPSGQTVTATATIQVGSSLNTSYTPVVFFEFPFEGSGATYVDFYNVEYPEGSQTTAPSGPSPTSPTPSSPTQDAQDCTTMPSGTVVGMASSDNGGYWIADQAGQVDACGSATTAYGELSSAPSSPVIGIVATPDGKGYWLVGRNGAIYAFGDAGFYGSLPGLPASEQPGVPVVGMASTADGKGYWLVTTGGDIYSFGDAAFHGSTGNITLNKPIVGMALDPKTGGYWLDASDGGIFAFDAPFYGSMGATPLNKPVVGMAPDLATGGYWLVAADGGIFAFNAPFYGSTGNLTLAKPIVGMEASPSGSGYRFVASDGGIFDFGSSQFYGSAAG